MAKHIYGNLPEKVVVPFDANGILKYSNRAEDLSGLKAKRNSVIVSDIISKSRMDHVWHNGSPVRFNAAGDI